MEALLRLLMRKHIKFVLLSIADTQAPQVAKDTIREVSDEEVAHGWTAYKEFEDFVNLGYYANAEGTILAINNKVLSIAQGKKDFPRKRSGPKRCSVIARVRRASRPSLTLRCSDLWSPHPARIEPSWSASRSAP